MQLNSLEHIINFTGTKYSRIACLINLTRGNVIMILISVFYFIFHSLKDIFLIFIVRQKQLRKMINLRQRYSLSLRIINLENYEEEY